MTIFKFLSLCILSVGLQTAYAAQQEEAPQTEDAQDMERIEVQGSRPKLFYLSEYRRFQSDFINQFNELVDDSEMEVICNMESQTGSRMKKRNCQPRFINTIVSRETQRELSMGRSFEEASNVGEHQAVQEEILKEYKVFQKLTAKLLNKHPELADTYVKMEDAKAKYDSFSKK